MAGTGPDKELIHSVGGKITRMLVKDGEAAFVQAGCCNAGLQDRELPGCTVQQGGMEN